MKKKRWCLTQQWFFNLLEIRFSVQTNRSSCHFRMSFNFASGTFESPLSKVIDNFKISVTLMHPSIRIHSQHMLIQTHFDREKKKMPANGIRTTLIWPLLFCITKKKRIKVNRKTTKWQFSDDQFLMPFDRLQQTLKLWNVSILRSPQHISQAAKCLETCNFHFTTWWKCMTRRKWKSMPSIYIECTKRKKKMDNKIEMKMKKKKTLMWFKLTSLSRNRDRDDRTCLSKSFFVWNIFGNFFFFSFLLCSLSEFSFVCPKRFQAIKSKHTISLSCHRKSPT